MSSKPQWLQWCQRIQAIAQNGLTYAQDPYDIDRYSSLRGIAAEMLAEGYSIEHSTILELLDKETGYTTPKVDMRGVVFREDKLLMVRERSDGKWTLPGGWADVCASPAENVVREIFEESGFQTQTVRILAVYDRAKHAHVPLLPFYVYKIFVLCSLIDGTATTSYETDAVGFFSEFELPELSIGRTTPAQIRRMFEHHRNPNLPTDFDREGGE